MKTGHLRIIIAVVAGLIAASYVLAQQKPDYDMGKMQMLFLDQSPEWKAGDRADEIRKAHGAYM